MVMVLLIQLASLLNFGFLPVFVFFDFVLADYQAKMLERRKKSTWEVACLGRHLKSFMLLIEFLISGSAHPLVLLQLLMQVLDSAH